jgi:23S rRNA pseudouridine2457 synthase
LNFRPGFKYIAFFKPYAVLCQFSQPQGSDKRTLAAFGFPQNVYPVGRLDYDSEGLLLLSDDKRLTSRLLQPSHARSYLAQVERLPAAPALEKLAGGVIIDGRKTLKAGVRLLPEAPELPERQVPIRFRKNVETAWLEITLFEGRNRQVRRMTAAVGHPTLRLVRIAIGELSLSQLKLAPGAWRELAETELNACLA